MLPTVPNILLLKSRSKQEWAISQNIKLVHDKIRFKACLVIAYWAVLFKYMYLVRYLTLIVADILWLPYCT